jgi:hypothetical protein
VIPVMDMAWKRSWRASLNPGGMCFKIMPRTPPGPAALWSGVRRIASCIIIGVMHLDIIEMVCFWLGGIWESHGNYAPSMSEGFSERACVSSFCTCAMISIGSTMRWPMVSSRMIERFVGRS